MNRSFLLLALFSFILFGCSDSGTSGSTDDPNAFIIPLNVGYYWVMDNSDFSADGSSHAQANDTIKISPQTRLSPKNETFYDYDGRYVTKHSDGLYSTDNLSEGPYLYIKYPASVGDAFRDGRFTQTTQMTIQRPGKSDTSITLYTRYTVAGKDKSISVPAGNYSCYEYLTAWFQDKTNTVYQEDHLYFSPNIGQIMVEHFERNAAGSMILKHRSRLLSSHLQ